MRPIKLSLSAFGPFSTLEVIDFETLGENPLFLITGPTGSGKTTILDGICFALYGKTTGDEREASQMRCDAAPEDVLTYVELVFSLQGMQWRIRREPEQLRPKGRGEGLTLHQPSAALYRRDATGKESVMVASKVTEARIMIEELTGLNVEQFRQVMVLPQGEFRNLLMAKSTDREKVFSHLFQTQIYSRIEFALKDKAAVVRKQLEASHNQQKGVLSSANIETPVQLATELESQSHQLKISAEHKAQAVEKQKKAQHDLLKAQQVAAEFDRLQQAKLILQGLVQQTDEMDAMVAHLQQARAALRIQPGFDQLRAATKTSEQSKQNIVAAQQNLKACQKQFEQADEDLKRLIEQEEENEAKQQHKRDLDAYLGRASHYASAMASLQACARVQQEASNTLETHRSLIQEKQTALQVLQQQQQDLGARLKNLAKQQLELLRLETCFQNRQQWDDAALKIKNSDLEMQKLARARSSAIQQLDLFDTQATRLEQAWHAGQAAALAKKLKRNQPCPVCGSEDHPAPARSEIELPGEQARQDAASNVTKANKSLSALEAKISGQEVLKAHLQDIAEAHKTAFESDFGQNLDEIISAQNAQQQQVQSLLDDELTEKQCAKKMAHLTLELDKLQPQLKQAERVYAQADTRAAVAKSEVRQAQVELPEPYRLSSKLEAEIVELKSQISAYLEHKNVALQKADKTKLALSKAMANHENAGQQQKAAQLAHTTAKEHWQQLIAHSPLADEAIFRQSRLNDEQMAAIEKQIQQHTAEMDQAKGVISSLEQTLSGKGKPELKTIELAAQAANLQFESAESDFANIDKRVARLQDVMQKLDEAQAQEQKLEDFYAVIGTLADTATGKTGNRISLQRFVLSVLLDDVLLHASTRFKQMSKGRYELYRQQEKGKGGGASGLELLVDDAYTGKHRPVATLSGGESFMAALSLALGLSDVVQAYAGGIKLDMLFIDEGFGSLDPESLDLAINTLIDLQSSGRMVGIISHVPELKERINVRLDVVTTRAGSHVRSVLA